MAAFFTTILYFVHSFFYSCPLVKSSHSRDSHSSNRASSSIPTPNDIGPSKIVTDLLADVESGTGVGASQKPKLRPLRLSLLSGKGNIGVTRVETVRSGNGPALLSGSSLRGLGRTSRIATLGLVVSVAALVSVCGLIDSSRVRIPNHFLSLFPLHLSSRELRSFPAFLPPEPSCLSIFRVPSVTDMGRRECNP